MGHLARMQTFSLPTIKVENTIMISQLMKEKNTVYMLQLMLYITYKIVFWYHEN